MTKSPLRAEYKNKYLSRSNHYKQNKEVLADFFHCCRNSLILCECFRSHPDEQHCWGGAGGNVTPFDYSWEDWVMVTDGVSAIYFTLKVCRWKSIWTHQSLFFKSAFKTISFPRFQLKFKGIKSKLLVHPQKCFPICASVFPSTYSSVVLEGLHWDHSVPNCTTETAANDLNGGRPAAF